MNALASAVAPIAPARVGLTDRQLDCFTAIQAHIANCRQSPTTRELAKAMGLSSPGRIHFLLVALQERGWITFLPRRARSIAIVPDGAAAAYTLPPNVERALQAHCALFNESPAAVVADAVVLMLDEAEGKVAA
jgi:SOS-response transcriptional repressor LexA